MVASKADFVDGPSGPTQDQGVLGHLGMREVRMVFPTREEWLDPSLLLRRERAMPEYVGGEVAAPPLVARRPRHLAADVLQHRVLPPEKQ